MNLIITDFTANRRIAAVKFLRFATAAREPKFQGHCIELRKALDAIDALASLGTRIVVRNFPAGSSSLARIAAESSGVTIFFENDRDEEVIV